MAALAAALLAFGAWVARQDWPKYRRLQSSGASVDGWVTAKDPQRGAVLYSFNVGGKVYSGSGQAVGNWEEGDRIAVFYMPGDPLISAPGDPKEHVRRQNQILMLAAVFFPGLIGLLLWRELRRYSVSG